MNQTESPRRPRRIVLFLFAILIPSLVLITLAVQVVRQEAELAEKRLADEQRASLNQLRRELSARLDAIRLQEVNRLLAASSLPRPDRSPDSPIVFVAPLEQDRLLLPWRSHQSRVPASPEFYANKAEGESREFLGNDFMGAFQTYRQSFASASIPAEKCEAQLWMGRALLKAGQSKRASSLYRLMLDECEVPTDEEGISFGLYAAERLLSAGLDAAAAQNYALKRASLAGWRSPLEAYLMRSLLADRTGPEAESARARLTSDIHDGEQILALANEALRLGRLEIPSHGNLGPGWLAYGDEPWLITRISPRAVDGPVSVLAVSSRKIAPPGVRLVTASSDHALALGEGFAGLFVEWPPGFFSTPPALPAWWYGVGIALILGITMLAGYLFLRDVNREVQIAEMRSHFVASVSHELKTPLTAIRMFAETLALGRNGSENNRSEYLKTIVNESERLSRLVDNVLDFARIEQDRKIYQMQPASLPDVVRSAARAMQYPLSQKGFDLSVSIEENLPPLLADADAIEQAILNLLANAMKYSGESRRIELRLRLDADEAVIEVTDWGLGIEKEDQTRIFEKFYRIRSTEADRVPGAGLGLTLALHAVKAHGGRLDVTSELGRGSTFSIRMPFTQQEAKP